MGDIVYTPYEGEEVVDFAFMRPSDPDTLPICVLLSESGTVECEGGKVPLTERAVKIVSGYGDGYNTHLCILTEKGNVACLGTSSLLGYGDNQSRYLTNEPGSFLDFVPIGGKAIDLFAGSSGTCAVLEEGIRCWGRNDKGQLFSLKRETIGDDEPPSSVPVFQITGAIDDIVIGESHSCILFKNGKTRCFGEENYLGNGENSIDGNLIDIEKRVTSLDIKGYSALGINSIETCLILESRDIHCFGNNEKVKESGPVHFIGGRGQPVIAEFDAPKVVIVGQPFTMDASKSYAQFDIDSYSWNFDDNNTASGQKVSHTYNEFGKYEVSLTITDQKNRMNTITRPVVAVYDDDIPLFHNEEEHHFFTNDNEKVNFSIESRAIDLDGDELIYRISEGTDRGHVDDCLRRNQDFDCFYILPDPLPEDYVGTTSFNVEAIQKNNENHNSNSLEVVINLSLKDAAVIKMVSGTLGTCTLDKGGRVKCFDDSHDFPVDHHGFIKLDGPVKDMAMSSSTGEFLCLLMQNDTVRCYGQLIKRFLY